MRWLVLVAAVALLPGSARAFFVVIDQHRSVFVGGQMEQSAPGDLVFDHNLAEGVASAGQYSDLEINGFSGSGSFVDTTFSSPTIGAGAILDVEFEVSVATTFTLTGQIGAIGDSDGYFDGPGGAHTVLGDTFSLSGALVPAETYRLHLSVGIPAGTTGPFRGSWNFKLVPEPTTGEAALAFVVLLAAGRRWSRRRPRA